MYTLRLLIDGLSNSLFRYLLFFGFLILKKSEMIELINKVEVLGI